MSFKIEVSAWFGDPEANFANYPGQVMFDLTYQQTGGPSPTIDFVVEVARARAAEELPSGLELKSITISIYPISGTVGYEAPERIGWCGNPRHPNQSHGEQPTCIAFELDTEA